LAIAVDDIAERIRSLGIAAPATYRAFAELSSIKEVDGVPEASEMINLLTLGHEQVVRTSRVALGISQ
jgi:starvation-inducible DNA-binding protein